MSFNTQDPSSRRRESGFTLVEVLASSVFGAMLLMALAYATTEFVIGVTHMEAKAGISDGEAKVLRRLTREVREAWYAEVINSERLRIADPDGGISEFYLDATELKLKRPNGDLGVILSDVAVLDFEGAGVIRKREGVPTQWDSTLYTRSMPGSSPFALEVPVGGLLSMAFQAPVTDDDLPSGGIPGDEVLIDQGVSLFSAPLAWVAGTDPEDLIIEVFESWAPGSAKPLDSALGSVAIPGSSLTPAVWNGSSYDVPATSLALSVSGIAPALSAGTGYVVVLHATGDAKLITQAQSQFPDPSNDDVALNLGSFGSTFSTLPVAVPFSVAGPYTLSTSVDSSVVATVSIQLQLKDKDLQIRSATLLGQALSDDPWSGVVPGDAAP